MENVVTMAFELCGVIVVGKDIQTEFAAEVTLLLQSIVSHLIKVAHVQASQRCRLWSRNRIFLRHVFEILVNGDTLKSIVILDVSYHIGPLLINKFIGKIAEDAGTWEAAMSQ